MSKQDKVKMPLKYKIFAIVVFGGLSLSCLYSFPNNIYQLIHGMNTLQPVIHFSKKEISEGGFMLSCIAGFIMIIFCEKMSPKVFICLFSVAFYGLLIALISPYLVMFWVDHFVEENHYNYCEPISDHEGKYWTTVYTKTTDICQIETEKVKNN
ncbi:hypothetical protein [Vibrio aerogenes]|uniref:hypothetical protein n=1 Tax=Vibrio aerogenes TaxID=92172 RepID=UPI0011148B3F|nr:hypothetical protein [Vibrio aerogenes]